MIIFALEDPEAKQIAHDLSMVPLIPELVQLVKRNIISKISCQGTKVVDLIAQADQLTGFSNTQAYIIVIVASAVVGLSLLVLIGWQYKIRMNVGAKKWLIGESEVTIGTSIPTLGSNRSGGVSTSADGTEKIRATYHSSHASSLHSIASAADEGTAPVIWSAWGLKAGFCRGDSVLLFEFLSKKPAFNYRYDTCKQILFMNKTLSHDNVLAVLGMMQDPKGTMFHIYKSNAKSSLHHILACCPYELNDEIKFTLTSDICRAMAYLHKNGIIHGMLDTWNCLMDSNWTLRVANWCHVSIAALEGETDILSLNQSELVQIQNVTEIKRTLFRHPDFLSGLIGRGKEVKKLHDLYSYAMVLIEIFSRKLPYADEVENAGGWEPLFRQLCKRHHFPNVQANISQHLKNLINQLAKNLMQVTFDAVYVVLEMSKTGKKGAGIVDTLMKTMEDYMAQLETKVAERTEEMKTVMTRMDELLRNILPQEVAQKLQNGETVEPKFFESISVYFSDIVQFTKLSSHSTPLEVVNFLNALYTMFDKMVEKYDVYKVETIGDAYMCVSGLPRPNGYKHAPEIVRFALSLLQGVLAFKIPHRPQQQLKVRIGVHSGSVIAGVVGLKMPRYCLLGEAVDIAGKMESSGLPNQIQASENTVKVLEDEFAGEFVTEFRGQIEIKDKSLMKTYWVLEATDVASCKSALPNTPSSLQQQTPEGRFPITPSPLQHTSESGFPITPSPFQQKSVDQHETDRRFSEAVVAE